MFRRLNCLVVSALLLWLSAGPALAAEPLLTETEQREVLGYLGELGVLRQENAQLREIILKDTTTITSFQAETSALRQAQTGADRIIAAQDKLSDIQDKAMKAYKELALAEGLRADRAEKRLESAEKWAWAGWVGTAVGIAAIVGSIIAK